LVGAKPLALDHLVIHVVGPRASILDCLRDVWLKWLAKHRTRGIAGEGPLAVAADQSVPNLSSIVMLAVMDGRSLLLGTWGGICNSSSVVCAQCGSSCASRDGSRASAARPRRAQYSPTVI
jgi:hypothetical protein